MVRKKIGLMGLLILSALTLAETKTTYMIIPTNAEVINTSETGAKQYLYLLTMDEDDGILEDDKIVVTKNRFYEDENPEENHTDLYKVAVTSETDVKIVVGYKITGKDRYVILAADDVDGDLLQDNYEDIVGTTDSPFGIVSLDDYDDYDVFPGHIVVDQTILSAMRAGEKASSQEVAAGELPDGLDDPSNVTEKFYQPPTEGDSIKIGAGTQINPSNSWKNYEFTVTYKNDAGEDVPIIIMKNEDGENLDDIDNEYIGEDGVIDLKNLDKDGIIAGTNVLLFDGVANADLGPFTIRVRFKGGDIEFNGVSYSQKTFEFIVKEPSIYYGGSGNEFWLEIDEDGVLFPPGERPEDAPPKPVGPAVYVIESEGLKMDGEAEIKSKSDESEKQRVSDVDIKILESGEGNFQIKNIAE